MSANRRTEFEEPPRQRHTFAEVFISAQPYMLYAQTQSRAHRQKATKAQASTHPPSLLLFSSKQPWGTEDEHVSGVG